MTEAEKNETAYAAVRALVATRLKNVEYVRAGTIRTTWVPTGKVVELRVLSMRNLQIDMVRLVGSLATFAETAHADGKAAHVLRAMRDLVPHAYARARAAVTSSTRRTN